MNLFGLLRNNFEPPSFLVLLFKECEDKNIWIQIIDEKFSISRFEKMDGIDRNKILFENIGDFTEIWTIGKPALYAVEIEERVIWLGKQTDIGRIVQNRNYRNILRSKPFFRMEAGRISGERSIIETAAREGARMLQRASPMIFRSWLAQSDLPPEIASEVASEIDGQSDYSKIEPVRIKAPILVHRVLDEIALKERMSKSALVRATYRKFRDHETLEDFFDLNFRTKFDRIYKAYDFVYMFRPALVIDPDIGKFKLVVDLESDEFLDIIYHTHDVYAPRRSSVRFDNITANKMKSYAKHANIKYRIKTGFEAIIGVFIIYIFEKYYSQFFDEYSSMKDFLEEEISEKVVKFQRSQNLLPSS